MMMPDVNVLLGAFRPELTSHSLCRAWLQSVVLGETRFAISPLVLSGVIRVSTNHRAFSPPSPLADAIAFCNDVAGQPHCVTVAPGDRHWSIFTSILVEADIRGPRVSDAWFAALAIEHGCEWITMDRDYARFPGLKWGRPVLS